MSKSLTRGEMEVMNVLWEHGEMKPAEIEEIFPREIKNAALRFQLRTLLEKGHVARRKVGKAYYYKAKTRRQGAFRSMTRRMANAFCQGSAAGLIAELLKTEDLSEEEIKELQRIAKRKKSNSK